MQIDLRRGGGGSGELGGVDVREVAGRLSLSERKSIHAFSKPPSLKDERSHRACAQKLQLTTMMTVTGPINAQMKWLSTLSQHLQKGKKREKKEISVPLISHNATQRLCHSDQLR